MHKCNKISPLKYSSDRVPLTDTEKAENIGKTFKIAHFTNYYDRMKTEAEVSSFFINMNFFTTPVAESFMPTPREICQLIRKLKSKRDQMTMRSLM